MIKPVEVWLDAARQEIKETWLDKVCLIVYIPGTRRKRKRRGQMTAILCLGLRWTRQRSTPDGCSQRGAWGSGDAAASQSIAHPDIDSPLRRLWTWIKSHSDPDCLSTSSQSCWHWPPRAKEAALYLMARAESQTRMPGPGGLARVSQKVS